jgi:phenylacetic acid degradation operon negative regulatory protein
MAVVLETTVEIPTRVLVLGMADEDGTLRTESILPVAEACGQTAEQVRSCLRRLVSEGLFRREGSGRNAVYTPTEAGASRVGGQQVRLRRAFAQDAAGRGWDRRWHLAAFAIPESRRAARDAVRDAILALGGAPIQGGLYASPHPWEDELRAEAKRLGAEDALTLAGTDDLDVGGVRDPRVLAATLWPLERVAARYEAFVEAHADVPAALEAQRDRHERIPDADFLPLALTMAVRFARCSADDPFLPPELLPRPWPGRTARDIVARSRRLALQLRSGAGRPALFGYLDELLDTIHHP